MGDIYILINQNTAEIVAYTVITLCDVTTKDLLETRLESAIVENLIPDDEYIWEKSNNKWGILI